MTTQPKLASLVLPPLENPIVVPVLSRTRPGVIHLVVEADDPIEPGVRRRTCTCEATSTCWHIHEVYRGRMEE